MGKLSYDTAKRTVDFQNKLLDTAFASAVRGGSKTRDLTRLVDCLRRGFAITKREHLDKLAELILPPKKSVGRPKGASISARQEAVFRIAAIVKRRERGWQKLHPNRQLYGFRKKAIDQVFELLERDHGDDSFSFPREITREEVKAALDRPRTSRKKKN